MPIVLLDNPEGNDWRGTIHPKDWHEWFDSYRNIMQTYAWIAEGNHVDLLVVGSELVSAEKHLDEWDHTIELIRETYHGKLTYSSNWDHYRSVEFWNKLDLIGMNSYWSFGEEKSNPNPSLDHIVDRWHEIQEDLFAFQKKVKKPIIFLEIGWFSQQNVAYEPWDYTKDEAGGCRASEEAVRRILQGLVGGSEVWADSASGNGHRTRVGRKTAATRPRASPPRMCSRTISPSRGGKLNRLASAHPFHMIF